MKLSAAENAAKQLRREILGLPEDTHLGLEEELSARLGISRPTFRQTARMLIQEQLLTVRRGVKGGYYTSRPDAKTVSQLATTFLVLARADLLDLLATSHALFREAMRSASLSTDEVARARLIQAMNVLRSGEVKSTRALLAEDLEVMVSLLRLTANPVIDLFLQVIYNFGSSEANVRIFENRPDRIAEWREQRLLLGEAVLEGNPERATVLAEHTSRLFDNWVREDMGTIAPARAAVG